MRINAALLIDPMRRRSWRHEQGYLFDMTPSTRRIHVRTAAQREDVPDLERTAVTQEWWVISAMRTRGAVIASQLWNIAKAEGHDWPLTSIRRTLTNLKHPDRYVVHMLPTRRPGLYGMEHEWKLATWARADEGVK